MQQVMFSHVDVAGIGGEQAVAMVGTPLAIGLPVALERPLTRPAAVCEYGSNVSR